MKADEQLLLNYMYMKGFTDEEMFDEIKISQVRNSVGFITFKINRTLPDITEKISTAFSKLVESIQNAWDTIRQQFGCEMDSSTITNLGTTKSIPIDFNIRPIIKDQVVDRKPRHLTRKIIH